MQELVKVIVNGLVDDITKVDIVIDEENSVININADKSEIGRIIGKQGRVAKAIRAIIKSSGMKQNKRYSVEINEK
ncbi:MAG: KH domain-containing protein [Clostridia bacterium]|nr:KH domain-containing protein [Clostridia bacterium]